MDIEEYNLLLNDEILEESMKIAQFWTKEAISV